MRLDYRVITSRVRRFGSKYGQTYVSDHGIRRNDLWDKFFCDKGFGVFLPRSFTEFYTEVMEEKVILSTPVEGWLFYHEPH